MHKQYGLTDGMPNLPIESVQYAGRHRSQVANLSGTAQMGRRNAVHVRAGGRSRLRGRRRQRHGGEAWIHVDHILTSTARPTTTVAAAGGRRCVGCAAGRVAAAARICGLCRRGGGGGGGGRTGRTTTPTARVVCGRRSRSCTAASVTTGTTSTTTGRIDLHVYVGVNGGSIDDRLYETRHLDLGVLGRVVRRSGCSIVRRSTRTVVVVCARCKEAQRKVKQTSN